MSSEAGEEVKAPMGPPDCPWRKISSNSALPESVVYKDGKLEGNEVYLGRVYDGKNLFIGTAIPKKGICIYLNEKSEVKTSHEYEILTVSCGDPLEFQDMDSAKSKLLFVAGKHESGERLYIGRHVDDEGNTYYGWIHRTTQTLHIPIESSSGAQVIDKGISILVHKFLDRLCICPPCPKQCPK